MIEREIFSFLWQHDFLVQPFGWGHLGGYGYRYPVVINIPCESSNTRHDPCNHRKHEPCKSNNNNKRHHPCKGNNGTKSSFNNSGSGKQNFGNGKFNTGAQISGNRVPSNSNNGTMSSFNNSGSGKQDFGNGRFNTGARIGRWFSPYNYLLPSRCIHICMSEDLCQGSNNMHMGNNKKISALFSVFAVLLMY